VPVTTTRCLDATVAHSSQHHGVDATHTEVSVQPSQSVVVVSCSVAVDYHSLFVLYFTDEFPVDWIFVTLGPLRCA